MYSTQSKLLIEVLVEDRSGGFILEQILSKMIAAQQYPWVHHIYAHRGCGPFPKNPEARPAAGEAALLPLLSAKIRAYNQAKAECPDTNLIVVVVLDSDREPPKELFGRLLDLVRRERSEVPTIIGLATEELEAWLLGDPLAVLAAYPEADREIIESYEQDSICGTWEVLCRAILGEQAEPLIQLGYPAVGRYKFEWASRIAPYLNLERNRSPSFQRFFTYLNRGLQIHAEESPDR